MNRERVARELMRAARELTAKEFDSPEALKKYLKEHPKADKSKHTVKKQDGGKAKEEQETVDDGSSSSAGSDGGSFQTNSGSSYTPQQHSNIEGETPGDYASMWGGTSTQAQAHFYNYSSKSQTKDKAFYDEWIDGDGGIKDTLEKARAMDGDGSADVKALTQLLEQAEYERQNLGKTASRRVRITARGRARLTARNREARDSLIDVVIDQRKLARLRDDMDEQTYDLMVEVYSKLSDDLQLTSGQQEALNRLRSSMERGFAPAMHRNNIFKAAHALGMKLPSMMF